MSVREYQDDCPGCQPAMLDMQTRKPVPLEDPKMQAILTVFNKASRDEKVAFHEVTCNNSRDRLHMIHMSRLVTRMQAALERQ